MEAMIARTIKTIFKIGSFTRKVKKKNTAERTNMIRSVLFISRPNLSYTKTAIKVVKEITKVQTVKIAEDCVSEKERYSLIYVGSQKTTDVRTIPVRTETSENLTICSLNSCLIFPVPLACGRYCPYCTKPRFSKNKKQTITATAMTAIAAELTVNTLCHTKSVAKIPAAGEPKKEAKVCTLT